MPDILQHPGMLDSWFVEFQRQFFSQHGIYGVGMHASKSFKPGWKAVQLNRNVSQGQLGLV
ncbi:hypothetical protein, partial [Rhizobium leguminosarum]|uniref:hypothetical protein n=1 Tax=Rhizobium leguminosarum TaxID=384 RepID=UPI003F98C327